MRLTRFSNVCASNWHWSFLSLLVVCVATLSGNTKTVGGFAVRYRVIHLALKPSHISNSGEVVGMSEENHAAIWTEKTGLRLLPIPKEFNESEAADSNALMRVVGSMTNREKTNAFIYKHGQLSVLTGRQSRALGINDRGEIVGQAIISEAGPLKAVIWTHEIPQDLGGCCGGTAKKVNRKGEVIGDLYDEEGRYHAFVWEASEGMRFLGAPKQYSSAIAINGAGHVLVQEMERNVVLYLAPDRSNKVPTPANEPAEGRALNAADEIVGAFGPYFDADHAFLWSDKDGFHDLNDLVPKDSGWKLQVATGINDQGEIVGFGDYQGDDAGFLLRPMGR